MHTEKNKINDAYLKAINKSTELNSSLIFSYSARVDSIDIDSMINYTDKTLETTIYWKQKTKRLSFISLGEVLSLNTDKLEKDVINKEIYNILNNMISLNLTNENSIPTFIGGQSFNINKSNTNIWAGYPTSNYLVPKILIMNNNNNLTITFYYLINKDSAEFDIEDEISKYIGELSNFKSSISNHQPDISSKSYALEESELLNKIDNVKISIENLELIKVVLSNILIYSFKSLDYKKLITTLTNNYPNCSVFYYKLGNKGIFFGASPEMILKRKANRLMIDALAGTVTSGDNQVEFDKNHNFLFKNSKINKEHDIVIKGIGESLAKINININSGKREIMKLKNLLHLKTSITAEIGNRLNVMNVLDVLSPTPALSGYPMKKSIKKIDELETFDRGWYSGPVGWINNNFDCEFYAGLRSAYSHNNKINIYAGAGITIDSDPNEELNEINSKFKSIDEIINE